jgi:hypothetical protein
MTPDEVLASAQHIGSRACDATFPLFERGRRAPALIGSGVVIRIGSVPFLLTAAHVFDGVKRPPVQLGTDGPILPITGPFKRLRAQRTTQREWTDKLDVAIYRLPAQASANLQPSSFLSLDDVDPP